MKNLMLESDLAHLEENLDEKEIYLNHTKKVSSDEKTNREFFESRLLKTAEKMAQFYITYYCIENAIRQLINGVLEERYGLNWWDEKVPGDLKESVKDKKESEKNTAIIRSEDPLTYTSFGDLIKIFETNWDDFSNLLRSKKSMNETLLQLNKLRNIVAHNCELSDLDIQRFNLHVRDWFLREYCFDSH